MAGPNMDNCPSEGELARLLEIEEKLGAGGATPELQMEDVVNWWTRTVRVAVDGNFLFSS
jgi:hypothetical protein